MKKTLAILLFTFSMTLLKAQEFEVPKNCVLNKPEDYVKYENDVIKGCNWIMTTPIKEQTDKRKDVNAFLLKWISGSPNVSIEITEKIVTFGKLNPDLLMIFMAGWTKYAIENKDYTNKLKGNLSGIESVIEFYQKNSNDLKKDSNVEKYIKMKEKGTLEDYVKKNI